MRDVEELLAQAHASIDAPALDVSAVRRRGQRARLAVGVVGVVVVLGIGGGWVLTQTGTQEAVVRFASPVEVPRAPAPHGYARPALDGEFNGVPIGLWWTHTATVDSVEDPRSLAHPDTILVAGWADAVIEGYQRNPDSAVVNLVPAVRVVDVPIDPDWPPHWLILDATTFEVVDTLPHQDPDDAHDAWPPAGFTELTGADAQPYLAAVPADLDLTVSVHTDGQIVGIRALRPDQVGYLVRFDRTNAGSWFHAVGTPVELDGFEAYIVEEGEPATPVTYQALSVDGTCGFVISTVTETPQQVPDDLRALLRQQIPARIASLCP